MLVFIFSVSDEFRTFFRQNTQTRSTHNSHNTQHTKYTSHTMSSPAPDTSTLFAYRSRLHQALVGLTVLLPIAFIGILALFTNDLSEVS